MIKAYTSYFVSYLILNFKDLDKIFSIILFGSVARGDFTKESDIDIFIDVSHKTKKLDERIKKIIEDFYKSREALIFKSKGISNKINVIIGKLDEWKELEKSIESTGIVLYGKFVPSKIRDREKKQVIFFWDKIGENRGAFLNKIYGFNSRGKRYNGLVEIYGGKRLGKSSIIVPVEYRENILKLIKHYKVNSKIIEIYS